MTKIFVKITGIEIFCAIIFSVMITFCMILAFIIKPEIALMGVILLSINFVCILKTFAPRMRNFILYNEEKIILRNGAKFKTIFIKDLKSISAFIEEPQKKFSFMRYSKMDAEKQSKYQWDFEYESETFFRVNVNKPACDKEMRIFFETVQKVNENVQIFRN